MVEVQVEGKIAGLQTEIRQGFEVVNARFEQQDTTMNARFDQIMLVLPARAPKPDQQAWPDQ